MSKDFQVEMDKVENSVSTIKTKISSDKIEVEYQKIINSFTDSKGKEANALRDLLASEKELCMQMDATLKGLADSIQFASIELQKLDKIGAAGIKTGMAASNLTVR